MVVVSGASADDLTPLSAAVDLPARVPDRGLLAIMPVPPGKYIAPALRRAPECGFCGAAGDTLLLTCSRCKSMRYCSAAHQKQHWYPTVLHVVGPILVLLRI